MIATIVSVIQAYRQLVVDQNNVNINKMSLKDYQYTIDMDQALIQAGKMAPTEVLQAKADYAQAQVTLESSITAVINDKYQLLSVLGLSPDTPIDVPYEIELCKADVPDLEKIYEIALKYDIAYLTAKLQVKVDERNLLVARDSARAALDLVIDASTGNGTGPGPDSGLKSLFNGRNNSASFTLNLDVPIDNLGLQAAIVQAQVQLEQDKITLANTARQLKITLSNDLADVKSNYVQIGLAETTLKLQQQNQDFLKAKLKFGLVTTFEVTTKQQDLDNARVQLIQTKINYLNSLTQLYSDMGKTLDEWNIKVRF
jgi:outer membrane protein TolC